MMALEAKSEFKKEVRAEAGKRFQGAGSRRGEAKAPCKHWGDRD